MKVKVLKKFIDKHNGNVYQVGEILTITKKRYNEILSVDKLVEEIEEKQD